MGSSTLTFLYFTECLWTHVTDVYSINRDMRELKPILICRLDGSNKAALVDSKWVQLDHYTGIVPEYYYLLNSDSPIICDTNLIFQPDLPLIKFSC